MMDYAPMIARFVHTADQFADMEDMVRRVRARWPEATRHDLLRGLAITEELLEADMAARQYGICETRQRGCNRG